MRFMAVLLSFFWMIPITGAQQRTVRHVLIVANNEDPSAKLAPLRFADDDGARYFELFSSLGAKTELLTTMDPDTQQLFPSMVGKTRPPTKKRLFSALSLIFEQIKQDQSDGMSVEFFFIFTGHGVMSDGKGGLLLSDGVLGRDELLKRVVEASPADFNHVIIDACNAYFAVMERGWQDDAGSQKQLESFRGFLQNHDTSVYPTTGFILSTAGTAQVHEWEKYRGGVFSYELRSGLLGPADVNTDGRVTYQELNAFLVAANAGVTNPKARLNVYVKAPPQNLDRPLVDLTEGSIKHFVTFSSGTGGHFIVEDSRGMSYAEWNQAPDHESRLALLFDPVSAEPEYFIRRGSKELLVRLEPLRANSTTQAHGLIAFDESRLEPLHARSRSSVVESFRRDLFSVPYGRAFYHGFVAGRYPRLELHEQAESGPGRNTLGLGYLLSGAILDSGEISHGVRLDYHWRASTHARLALQVDWRGYDAGREANSHTVNDIGLSLGAGAVFMPWDAWWFSLDGMVGNHFILYQRQKPGVDPDKTKDAEDFFAPGLSLEGCVRFVPVSALFIEIGAGLSVVWSDVEDKQQMYFIPEGSVEVGWIL